MKNLTILIFLIIPLKLFSQVDTAQIITIQFDTTWNHSILESDLILYLEIDRTIFVTQAGVFSGKILQVIKDEYNDSNFSIHLDLIEFFRERSEKRLGAICPLFDKMKLPLQMLCRIYQGK